VVKIKKEKLPEHYTKQDIIDLLTVNTRAIERAIVVLYTYQTQDEKTAGETREYNNVGFNRLDSGILSSFAEQINRGRRLTPKQLEIAKKKIFKYAGQLTNISNEKWRKENGIA
jgi:hypothetical protein